MLENFLLLPHVPKTGGSSFRHSLVRSLGSEFIICDYGFESKVSNKSALISIAEDSFKFFSKLGSLSSKGCFIGHFPVNRYAHFFNHRNIGIFVREPVQQVISHYEHKKRVDSYKGSLADFISDKKNQNLQSRYLGDFPLELVGFIGLVEDYESSIEVFNHSYGFNLDIEKKNVNKAKKINDNYTVDKWTEEAILETNYFDTLLYQKAKKIVASRKESLVRSGRINYGRVSSLNSRMVNGWLTDGISEEIMRVNIVRNGVVVSTVLAKEHCKDLLGRNVVRNGCVGFEYTFGHALGDNEKLECMNADTGESLLNEFR